MKVLIPAEMRELDKKAIETLGIPEAVLMENAATAALLVLEEQFHPCANPGLILCGTGNNGGDGLALARKLHSLNRPVRVLLFGPVEKLSPPSLTNFTILKNLPVDLGIEPEEQEWKDAIDSAGYLVDALFGTGLNRPLTGTALNTIKTINTSGKPVLSLDIPSGVRGETGTIAPIAVKADACVSFGAPKRGNILYPGFSFQGKLYCSPISFPPEYYNNSQYHSEINLPPELPKRDPEGYKNSFGKILLIGGGANYYGAPAMAAKALYRSGSGYVTIALPEGISDTVAALCPEAIIKPLESTKSKSIHPANLRTLLDLTESHDGVIIGPGMTRDPQSKDLIRRIIPKINRPLLIDADALFALAGQPELTHDRQEPTILTPHKGEQRTLLSQHTQETAIETLYNAITVYKGPHTSIKTPEGKEYINMTGNSGLGTAGSGDVLTGVIMALLNGLSPVDATRAGVLLHGLSADLAAESLGEDSLTASDLLDFLPAAIQFYRKNHGSLTENCYNTVKWLI